MIDEKLVIVLFSGGVIHITIFFLAFNFWLESIIGGVRDE